MEIIADKETNFLKQIPRSPGVYRFYGKENDELLYVGKAINLLKRVKSYFHKTLQQSPRINLMIAQIVRIEITITDNEVGALILENNLIKSLNPKYNIIFRDDKSYPLIRLSRHQFPRIDTYRGKTNESLNQYFGPYPNAQGATAAIELVQKLFKLRTCANNVFANRTRACMLYQIKRCTAPCVGSVTTAQYQTQVDLAVQFLRGNYAQLAADLDAQMHESALHMEFEAAALVRDKIALLNNIYQQQMINNHNQPLSADIVTAKSYLNRVFVYVISLINGIYSGDKHFIINDPDNNIGLVLEVFIQNYYLERQHTQRIYIQVDAKNSVLDAEFLQMFHAATKIKIIQTRSRQLRAIYKMAALNLGRIIANTSGDNELEVAAIGLAHLLELESIKRIECIDISHHQGANTVASCVVYQDGRIDKSLYRQYNLPDSVGGDDLAGMQLVLERRLKAVDTPLPQVILIDGGITQYNMLKNLIQSSAVCGKIRAVSIFKGEKRKAQYDQVIIDEHRRLGYSEAPGLFKLLQSLRDEAHRFAITRHRTAQIKTMTTSKLENIPNIGASKRRSLLTHFGSLGRVMQASIDELCQVSGIGRVLAKQIFVYLHNE